VESLSDIDLETRFIRLAVVRRHIAKLECPAVELNQLKFAA
jgi:hypothetical protein